MQRYPDSTRSHPDAHGGEPHARGREAVKEYLLFAGVLMVLLAGVAAYAPQPHGASATVLTAAP
jgi:hypothetical protein